MLASRSFFASLYKSSIFWYPTFLEFPRLRNRKAGLETKMTIMATQTVKMMSVGNACKNVDWGTEASKKAIINAFKIGYKDRNWIYFVRRFALLILDFLIFGLENLK